MFVCLINRLSAFSFSSDDVRYNTEPCSPQMFEEGPLAATTVTVVVMEASTLAPTTMPTPAPTGEVVEP
jgi:hypothetical protein